ncbi:MAG: Crp/Fnr family transcriptional regulator [Clostridia bacterium]|nr:Crp/Fnr family transcriptional regulator [Eubacteriales bacterium]MDD3867589.1 Crp/Fnr family transcriptional regulator [Eubacteriales bacterium]MDD4460829.1 Crp/Fnr family transcriptional regulator [Eubacteriales bacterium]NCC48348.1 Crp/Fnr family transcriptional regulator [Clostridia bacterium]
MKKLCETLSATPLFAGLNHDAFHDYCSKTNVRLVWKGEVLVNEGDPCNSIGMIVDGQLALQKYSSSGDFATLELLGPNDLFGDDLIFGVRRTYPLTIEAVTNSKVVFVSRDVLMSLLYEAPAIMQNFLSILSDRVQQQNRRILLLSQKSLRQKISNYLLDLLREQREKEGESPRLARLTVSTQAVELPVSKEVVSRLLAMPRPSFSRELISMERDGLIRVSGRVIWLTDLDRLEKGVIEGFQYR